MHGYPPAACGERQRNLAAQPFGSAGNKNNGGIWVLRHEVVGGIADNSL